MKKTIVAGNWKMHGSYEMLTDYTDELSKSLEEKGSLPQIILAVPSVYLAFSQKLPISNSITIAAQDCHWLGDAAYTGEVSVAMLKDIDIMSTILGHSERRQFFGETDEDVRRKIIACYRENIQTILCIGETEEEREGRKTNEVLARQIEEALGEIPYSSGLIIAYEPIWAIGTGKTATIEQIQDVHTFIRGQLKGLYGESLAQSIPLLYGGSVKPSNVQEIIKQPNVNGVLVGGASLEVETFLPIIDAACSIIGTGKR